MSMTFEILNTEPFKEYRQVLVNVHEREFVKNIIFFLVKCLFVKIRTVTF